ncbi:hypothetical protein EUX98_g5272 [Antrodiella citrinella]|uniref:Cytochrome P450 n=1 Tax=Antrodiella citrinella TaxID=2447956 RepID=A0A4S4MSX1_9APHY|nr:hypothetical protein EUX98_g5272 [Antrodiella citrinella]
MLDIASTKLARPVKFLGIIKITDNSTKKVFEGKKAALAAGDEELKEHIGEGKDIMSILSTDTTTGTLVQILQLLVEHPDVQERLREEIKEATQGREIPYDELSALPYLNAICRKTLRMNVPSHRYPPVSFVYREEVCFEFYLVH